jgi:hypothetical protein
VLEAERTVRDDVLEAELRNRLGAGEEALRRWFDSLRASEQLRLLDLMEAQIHLLENEPGHGVVRREQLLSIRNLFSRWIDTHTGS